MASSFLTKDIVAIAAIAAEDLLHSLCDGGLVDGRDLYVVVIDPTTTYGEMPLEQAILHEMAIGKGEEYKPYARSKAEISWKYGIATSMVQHRYPYLYEEGMTKWAGGINYFGIPIGVSGVQEEWDEALAEVIGTICRAACIGPRQNLMLSPASFVGEETS